MIQESQSTKGYRLRMELSLCSPSYNWTLKMGSLLWHTVCHSGCRWV